MNPRPLGAESRETLSSSSVISPATLNNQPNNSHNPPISPASLVNARQARYT